MQLRVLTQLKQHRSGHTLRKLTVIVVMLGVFFTILAPGNSEAWTNNSNTYNLVESPSWGEVAATDGAGNSYAAIKVKGTFTIGNVTASVGNAWRHLILKTDRNGIAIWGSVILDGAVDTVGDVLAMKADTAGNVYLAGHFTGTVSIGGTPFTSAGDYDIWVAKLNSNGSVVWARSFGGANYDWGNGVGFDGSGNVYVSGGMQGSAIFGSTTRTSAGGNDLFVTKLNSSGVVQWATSIGGTGDDNGGWVQGLAVDAVGNAFVSGQIEGTVTVAGNTLTGLGDLDAFVGKVNSAGVWQWGVIAGSSAQDHAYGVALDGQGGAYITGVYRGNISFGATTLTHQSDEDAYIAKVSASGAWQWARSVKGEATDYAYAIDTDSSGGPIIVGEFTSATMTVGSETLTHAGGGDYDGWAAKWDSAGAFQWAVHLLGTTNDGFYGIAVDSDNNARLSGYAGKSNTVSFDGAPAISIMSDCSSECWAFVEWKLASATGVSPTTTVTSPSPTTAVVSDVTTTTLLAPAVSSSVPASGNVSAGTSMPTSSTKSSQKKSSTTNTVAAKKNAQGMPVAPLPSSTTTLTPESVDIPNDTKVELGTVAVSVNGEKVATTLRREVNSIVVSGAGVTARYSITDESNQPAPLDVDGNLRVMPGQSINVSIEGASVNSKGEAWMFSNPMKLGSFEIDGNGLADESFKIPVGTEIGDHTLVIETGDNSDREAELRLGFAVGEMSDGVSVSRIAVVLLVVAGLIAVLLPVAFTRRRRLV